MRRTGIGGLITAGEQTSFEDVIFQDQFSRGFPADCLSTGSRDKVRILGSRLIPGKALSFGGLMVCLVDEDGIVEVRRRRS